METYKVAIFGEGSMRGGWGGGSGSGDVVQHGSLALPDLNYIVVMTDVYSKPPFSDWFGLFI